MSETPPDDEVVTRQAQEEAEEATADDDRGRAQTPPRSPAPATPTDDPDASEAGADSAE